MAGFRKFVAVFAATFFGVLTGAQTGSAVQVEIKNNRGEIERTVHLYKRSYALVIGIDKYIDYAWPKLSNAVKDARLVAKALKARGFKVTLKLDLGSAALKKAVEDFIFATGRHKDARLFIWYAGHGHTIDGEAYLVPADAPSPDTEDWKFRRRSLSMREFGRYMREARSRHILSVFDSCFSGTIFAAARSKPPAMITRAVTGKVRQFVSSGEADQLVSDDGTFRKLFLDALAGRDSRADQNGDGYLLGSELGLFLHQAITNYSRSEQTPRYGKMRAHGFDRGDFVFQIKAPVGGAPVAGQKTGQPNQKSAGSKSQGKSPAVTGKQQSQSKAKNTPSPEATGSISVNNNNVTIGGDQNIGNTVTKNQRKP